MNALRPLSTFFLAVCLAVLASCDKPTPATAPAPNGMLPAGKNKTKQGKVPAPPPIDMNPK
jgi:hypothetical protein